MRARDRCTGQRTILAVDLSSLLRDLARQWQANGNLARADSLYDEALSRLQHADVLLETAILQDWATLKLARGAIGEAEYLARRQTVIARIRYEDDRGGADLLASCLEFQAGMLERVGSTDAAHDSRREAAELGSVPNSCNGLCALGPDPSIASQSEIAPARDHLVSSKDADQACLEASSRYNRAMDSVQLAPSPEAVAAATAATRKLRAFSEAGCGPSADTIGIRGFVNQPVTIAIPARSSALHLRPGLWERCGDHSAARAQCRAPDRRQARDIMADGGCRDGRAGGRGTVVSARLGYARTARAGDRSCRRRRRARARRFAAAA
jgi:hypothetical protein